MADFLKAVEWMKQGKKVRRNVWAAKDNYWYFDFPEERHNNIMGHHVAEKDDEVVDYFSADLFLAKDWQIFKKLK